MEIKLICTDDEYTISSTIKIKNPESEVELGHAVIKFVRFLERAGVEIPDRGEFDDLVREFGEDDD